MTGVWKSYPSTLESEGRDASDGDVELEAEVALEVGCARGRSLHSVVRTVSAREKTHDALDEHALRRMCHHVT